MPGEVFPSDFARPSESHAERQVYDALKRQLPEGFCAWHSVRMRERAGRDGEADFVLAIPERGLLVLEVKGGRVELAGGHWTQNGRPMERAPRDQAQAVTRLLVQAVERRIGQKVPFGIGCVFPDVEFSGGPLTGDLRNAVIGKRQLHYLRESLPGMIDELLPRGQVPPFPALKAAVHALWGETWVPRVVLRDQLKDAAAQRFALDQEQLAILEMAGGNPRALVEGAAGTGKTVVARELCLRRADEGLRVLYLCFTEALASAIEAQLRESPHPQERLRAVAVRQYARELVGEEPPPRSADALEFWEQIPSRAIDRLPPPEARPDCVVVDEAQDLAAADWRFVEALAGEGGLWIFQDPRQSFWRERRLPDALAARLPRLKLRRQQRSPPVVERFAERFVDPEAREPLPENRTALQLVIGEEPNLLERLAATLDELTRAGARAEEIAVLSLGGQKRSVLQQLDALGGHRLVRCDSPEASGAVVADTFLRFKGLERPFVIIAELGGGLDHKFDVRMHIALTRATQGVRILCTTDELDRDPRLSALMTE